MRVAQFTTNLRSPLGGAEQYCVELAKWLSAHGVQTDIVTNAIGDDVREELETAGVTVRVVPIWRPYEPGQKGSSAAKRFIYHALDTFYSVTTPRALGSVLRGSGFDIVHVHRFQGVGAGILRSLGRRTVHTVHDFALVDTSATSARGNHVPSSLSVVQRLRAAANSLSAGQAGRLIYPSMRTRERNHLLGLRVPPEREEVIAHGWTTADRPPHATRSRKSDRPFTVLYLGKLSEQKGVELLLSAWGEGLPEMELRIAGAGPLDYVVGERAAVAHGLTFLGWLDQEQRAQELHQADLLVVPSLWPENFPLVVAEAALHGLPVLTTRSASPPLVNDGVSGLLVEPSAAALREALIRLAADPRLTAALARGMRELAPELDFDTHGQRIMALYERLLSKQHSRSSISH